MQNYKKNFVTRTLAWVLTVVMVVTMLPMGVFAETYEFDGEIVSTSWEDSRKEQEAKKSDNWTLAPKNRLVLASTVDPLRSPGIDYAGTYVNDKGKTVIRLVYTGYHTVTSNVWRKFVVKVPLELEDKIDWQSDDTGMYKSWVPAGIHDNPQYTIKNRFEDGVPSDTGGWNTHVIDLGPNANDNVPSSSSNLTIPMDFVLKDGNLSQFKNDLLFQLRIFDSNYKRTYSNADQTDQSYNAYTFSTVVPMRKDYNKYMEMDLKNQKIFGAALGQIKFNKEEGYIDVFHKQYKGGTLTDADNRYGFRQAVDSKFYDILKPNADGVIAQVFILDKNGQPYSGWTDNASTAPYKMRSDCIVNIKENYLNKNEGIGFLQVVNNKWKTGYDYENNVKVIKTNNRVKDAILGSGATGTNAGIYTVVRYYVDSTAIENAFKTKGLEFYTFYTSIIGQNQEGTSEFTYTNNGDDKVLPKGSIVKFSFDKEADDDIEVIVGDEVHNINFFDSIKMEKGSKDFTWTLPFGITIPSGKEIRVRNSNPKQTNLRIAFKTNGSDTVEVGNPVISHEPFMYKWSNALTGGTLIRTNSKPNVDEIFTDSDKFTGHVNYEGAKVVIKSPEASKIKEQYIYAKGRDKNKGDDDSVRTDAIVDKIKVKAFAFDTTKPNQGGFIQNDADKQMPDFVLPTLERDMPIAFANIDTFTQSLVSSPDVIEQVQTKFHFDLNGQKSKANEAVIDKIAPLSKEYKYDPETGAENTNKYVPSGFVGENVKYADDSKNTIEITEQVNGKDVTRTYQNIANHDGEEYDISIKDQKDAFLKRQMPSNEDVNLPNAKRIIGWTTVRLEDKDVNGKKVTAEEQFYDLLNAENESKTVKNVSDWATAENEAYIFNATSPIDKERTVYAVYGGLSIVLHSANAKNGQKETIVRIPITQSDIDTTKDKLDGMTEASINKIINKTIVKEMPKAPYTEKAEDVAEADERLKDFVKKDSTFIGWTTLENQETLVVGRNNPRIGALIKGEVSDEEQNKVKVPKSTESLTNLMENANKATLPSGFNFGIAADDFVVDGNRLSTREEILEKINEIHLYAVYRPFYEVTVKPQYNVLNRELKDKNHKNGTLEELSAEKLENVKDETLKIGLLTRTAVTGYGKPTVDATANYNPIEAKYLSDGAILKEWSKTSNQELKWHLPGYDELGRRKSYISVVVPDGKDDKYTNFANKFTSQSWSNLNISTNMKADGTALDPDAPKNYFYDGDIYRDPYGASLAKTQSLTIGKDQEHLDVFTSATARKVLLSGKSSDREEDREVTGYDIVMVNSLETLPTPSFEPVRNTDKKVTLEWDKGTDSKPTKYDSIDKIEFYLPKTNEKGELLDEEGKVINENNQKPPAIEKTELKKDTATGEFKSSDGNVKAVIDSTGKKLEVTGLNLTSKGGKDLKAKYFTTVAQKEVAGPEGTTKIIANKDSAPINEMRQGIKKDPRDNPTIKFTVPMKDLDQVGEESKYIAEKWDSESGQWVKVGEKVLGPDDKKFGQYQGNEYEIPLDNVVDGDKIRIVSMESNPDAKYTPEEKAADPRLEDNFSRPAYSTGDKNLAPDANKPGSKFVVLDLEAPHSDTSDPIKAADEKFRRYINIKGSLDELPDNQKVVLEINYSGKGQKQQGNFVKEFDTKEKLVEYLYEIPRIEDMPDMWIYAKDKFGNMEHTDTPSKSDGIKIEYEKTYQCKVFVMDATQRKKYINVTSDKDNAKVTAVVYSGNQELARGEATVTTANGYVRLALKVTGGAAYRLKKGDRIHITCEALGTENGKNITYTTNPFDIFVR